MWAQVQGQAGAYVRISSTDQTLVRQVTVFGEVQEPSPTGSAAGSRSERTVLTAMLRHVRRGDTVRAASMDRLTRSVVDLAQLVTEPAERGVRVEFIAA
jgi:DNA invertase Pin-like site-specific DNA recombinase